MQMILFYFLYAKLHFKGNSNKLIHGPESFYILGTDYQNVHLLKTLRCSSPLVLAISVWSCRWCQSCNSWLRLLSKQDNVSLRWRMCVCMWWVTGKIICTGVQDRYLVPQESRLGYKGLGVIPQSCESATHTDPFQIRDSSNTQDQASA